MNITFFVTRSSMPPFEEYCNEIKDLWDTRWLTNSGAKHRQFQAELCEYLSVENIELFTNGHMSLEMVLQALDLHGEVITTPFTFASTTHAIVRSGLTPVFCDVDQETYTLDSEKLEALITENTCAILPVHVYGNVCQVEEIDRIAKKHGLKVIYDACHTFGETYKGKGIGSFGDASCFSFHATKVFHTVEGGAASFRDKALGEKLACLKNFGLQGEDAEAAGPNAKMNEFCAAMGLCNLRYIDGEIEKRRRAVARYRARLEGVEGIQLNKVQPEVKSNYAYFPVIFGGYHYTRDQVMERLAKEGIMARKYFYPLTNDFACYRNLPTAGADKTPVARHLAEHVLTLPLYADLTERDVDRICDIILER